jgi:hypothetical protein
MTVNAFQISAYQNDAFQTTTTATTYDYEYSLVSGEHNFFLKAYLKVLVLPNKVIVSSQSNDENQYTGSSTSTASYALIPKTQPIRCRLSSNAQATSIASAMINKLEIQAETGYGVVPINVGAQVYDFVKITDARAGDTRTGNVGWIHEKYSAKNKVWKMSFGFGKPQIGQEIDQLLQDLDTYSDVGNYFARLSVKDLYAEHIHADSLDMVWIDPEGNIDLSLIGDTLDNLPDGATYARVRTTNIQAGYIYLDENTIYKSGYDPSTKMGAGSTLDDLADGLIYQRVLATSISAGHIQLTSDTAVSGKWYDSSGVSIDASNGIILYGSNIAFRTRATYGGADQCWMNSSGWICAGGGNVMLNSAGLIIAGSCLFVYDSVAGNQIGQIGYGASGLTLQTQGTYPLSLVTSGQINLSSATIDLGGSLTGWFDARFVNCFLLKQASTPVIAGLLPLGGHLVYNTSAHKLTFYNGSAWEIVTSGVP